MAPRRPRRAGKPTGAPYAMDEEGTEDIYKDFVRRLCENADWERRIDVDIEEINSIDWRAEQNSDGLDLMHRYLAQLEHPPVFLPRLGEMVLFCPDLTDKHELRLDENKDHKLWYSKQSKFRHFPTWCAGVVTIIPDRDRPNNQVKL